MEEPLESRWGIAKVPTGITGLDDITFGGLPKGRPTLIAGSAGCGKTMFGMQFLVDGAHQGEPGVFVAFEEPIEELVANFRSLGMDLPELEEQKLLSIDHIHVDRSEFEESGEYDLEGLFIRLNLAIESIGAKRIVLDTIETLFGGIPNTQILRSELHRLFDWLRNKGITAIVTGESGIETITRQGLEEYVSDCVILLSHRVKDDISTRRLRVVKYRGSAHGTNEYPFLIDEDGISVLPLTSISMGYRAFEERMPSGIGALDDMLAGGGFYRGSSILVSGMAGTGKSSIGAEFVNAACSRGERALYVSFEESEGQLLRNMRSIGLDLQRWCDEGMLEYHATRATVYGLEMHLVTLYKLVEQFQPRVVVIDPMTSLMSIGTKGEVQSTLTRLIDFLKSKGVTALFTSLISGGDSADSTEESVSSLMDTWLLLRNVEYNGERNRTLYLLKSRGMAHSNQVREFILTDEGVRLVQAYIGPAGVLTGTARLQQEAQERAQAEARREDIEARRVELERKRRAMEARIEELKADFAAEEQETQRAIHDADVRERALETTRTEMRGLRTGTGRSREERSEGQVD